MKAHYRAFNGRLIIEIEGSTIKDLFKQIGPVAEVLDGDDCCGKCHSVHIFPRSRDAKKGDGKIVTYYELVCSECGAKLSFGQHSEGGTLWAKREDEHGNKLEFRGWRLYLALPAPQQSSAPAAAPRESASPIKTASQTQRSDQVDLRLRALMEKAAIDSANANDVCAELYDVIEQQQSKEAASKAWTEAVRMHGDPLTKTEAAEGVVNHLYVVAYKRVA